MGEHQNKLKQLWKSRKLVSAVLRDHGLVIYTEKIKNLAWGVEVLWRGCFSWVEVAALTELGRFLFLRQLSSFSWSLLTSACSFWIASLNKKKIHKKNIHTNRCLKHMNNQLGWPSWFRAQFWFITTTQMQSHTLVHSRRCDHSSTTPWKYFSDQTAWWPSDCPCKCQWKRTDTLWKESCNTKQCKKQYLLICTHIQLQPIL